MPRIYTYLAHLYIFRSFAKYNRPLKETIFNPINDGNAQTLTFTENRGTHPIVFMFSILITCPFRYFYALIFIVAIFLENVLLAFAYTTPFQVLSTKCIYKTQTTLTTQHTHSTQRQHTHIHYNIFIYRNNPFIYIYIFDKNKKTDCNIISRKPSNSLTHGMGGIHQHHHAKYKCSAPVVYIIYIQATIFIGPRNTLSLVGK